MKYFLSNVADLQFEPFKLKRDSATREIFQSSFCVENSGATSFFFVSCAKHVIQKFYQKISCTAAANFFKHPDGMLLLFFITCSHSGNKI